VIQIIAELFNSATALHRGRVGSSSDSDVSQACAGRAHVEPGLFTNRCREPEARLLISVKGRVRSRASFRRSIVTRSARAQARERFVSVPSLTLRVTISTRGASKSTRGASKWRCRISCRLIAVCPRNRYIPIEIDVCSVLPEPWRHLGPLAGAVLLSREVPSRVRRHVSIEVIGHSVKRARKERLE